MKTFYILASALLLLTSCKKEHHLILSSPSKISNNETIEIKVSDKNEQLIDSVQFKFNGKRIKNNTSTSASLEIKDLKLGQKSISALVFFDGKTKNLTNTTTLFADSAPKIYHFNIKNTYHHDPKAYTQGLEYRDGLLYESTGQRGSSSLRKVKLETGEVLQKYLLDDKYFGEGMTIFDNQIFQLTWQHKIGFIYDLDFNQKGEFPYGQSKEGWGLTHDDTHLIKSDGTNKIWFLNPETQKEERFIEVYTNTKPIGKINELEYINGKIYANVWQRNAILIINPNNGKVEAIANMTDLTKIIHQVDPLDDVLNGIAYDKKNNRLFVTGKKWNKLFEIELFEKK